MKSKLALVDKVICVKTLTNEKGVVFSEEGAVWENTFYCTPTSVSLTRKRDNGIPEWLTVSHDLLDKHFEEYEAGEINVYYNRE